MERLRLVIHHAAMLQPTVSRYPLLASLLLLAGGCSDGGSSSNPLTEGAGGNGLAGASDTGGAASNGSGGSTNAGGAQGGVTGGTTGVGGQQTGAGGSGSGTGAAGGVGAGGTSANGGTSGAGGSRSGTGGAGGSGGSDPNAFKCKRGIAANKAPGAAFYPAIRWWYDWGVQGSGQGAGIEFVPMLRKNFGATLPDGSKFLLSFNEPNFKSQDNLTAAQAAADWPMVASKASPANLPVVGPGMNFCGAPAGGNPADYCNGTSPYQYLKDFFGSCSSCKVDYVAVHWYNCDLPSLKDYLEPGGNLEGFEQFGKPIWLTEFSCDGNASVAQQEAYMKAAIPYLEANPHVYRYSWFSADPIPNARLINGDGSPTDLGKVYISLDQTCN